VSTIDAYERVLLPCDSQAMSIFLFAAHSKDANSVQLGFGTESASKLQRAHIFGPLVHELHVTPLTTWLRRRGRINLLETLPPAKHHPLTSGGLTDHEYARLLNFEGRMDLAVGRFAPLVDEPLVLASVIDRFADAIDRVRIKAWGHPADWDVRFIELKDGRFVWAAYDEEIKKIRLGLGFHDASNEKAFGLHSYALGVHEAAAFAAFHFLYLDAPLQFMGLPPRWPHALSPFVIGKEKQAMARDFLKLADEIWPGEVTAPDA
jgi:hypothetical protein